MHFTPKDNKCGVVILNYKTSDLTIDLCKFILGTATSIDLIVYIVDNSCSDEEWLYLQEFCNDRNEVVTIRQENNVGYGQGNYVGIQKALADGCSGVIICNPDIQFGAMDDFVNFVKKIAFSLSEKAVALIAAPQVHNPFTRGNENPIYEPQFFGEVFGINNSKMVFSFCGCFFFLNYNALKAIDLFPYDVFMYNEELIIGKKLQKVSSNKLFIEDITILHCHKKNFKGFWTEFLRKHYQIKSRIYVFNSYFSGNIMSSFCLFILLWARGLITLLVKWYVTKSD